MRWRAHSEKKSGERGQGVCLGPLLSTHTHSRMQKGERKEKREKKGEATLSKAKGRKFKIGPPLWVAEVPARLWQGGASPSEDKGTRTSSAKRHSALPLLCSLSPITEIGKGWGGG